MSAFHKSKVRTGFTIIELMIVVAMIAVMVAVAIPSYQNYIQKSYMKAAAATIHKDGQFMEKWYSVNGKYTTGSAWPALPYTVSPESGTSLYRISFTSSGYSAGNDNKYTLIATPICGTQVANNGCVCFDQDANTVLNANADCTNGGPLCSCTN
ncbi:MAG: prepilin-type N-terminal cleavage/methylation domain-containing protein [Neisseriaceae bacterium]|nr:MAG: prepilin-type N-terminal cleavage/methylation domain-containing protein [Neisseriaceae bacterium]